LIKELFYRSSPHCLTLSLRKLAKQEHPLVMTLVAVLPEINIKMAARA
jgi:hypothetical protein